MDRRSRIALGVIVLTILPIICQISLSNDLSNFRDKVKDGLSKLPNLIPGSQRGGGVTSDDPNPNEKMPPVIKLDPVKLQESLRSLYGGAKLVGDALQDWFHIDDPCKPQGCITEEEGNRRMQERVELREKERTDAEEKWADQVVSINQARIADVRASAESTALTKEKYCATAEQLGACAEGLDGVSVRLTQISTWLQEAAPVTGQVTRQQVINQVARVEKLARRQALIQAESRVNRLLEELISKDRSIFMAAKVHLYCYGLSRDVNGALEFARQQSQRAKVLSDAFELRQSFATTTALRRLLELVEPICESHTAELLVAAKKQEKVLQTVMNTQATLLMKACSAPQIKKDSQLTRGCIKNVSSDDFVYAIHIRLQSGA